MPNEHGDYKVLLVEDSSAIMKMMEKVLTTLSKSHTVISVSSADEAFRLYKEALDKGEPFDAIVTDNDLILCPTKGEKLDQGKNHGVALIKAIREHEAENGLSKVGIAMESDGAGEIGEGVKNMAMEAGADHFWKKIGQGMKVAELRNGVRGLAELTKERATVVEPEQSTQKRTAEEDPTQPTKAKKIEDLTDASSASKAKAAEKDAEKTPEEPEIKSEVKKARRGRK
jgi:CheY-like chemotaxis protein